MYLPRRSRLWARPDPASARVGREGELLAARVRIASAAVAALAPLGSLVAKPSDPEPWIGVGGALLTVLLGVAVLAFARRTSPPPWLGFFTCGLDVSIVSAVNLALIVSGSPLAVTNGRTVYSVYLIALAFSCLRQDVRMCVTAGLTAILQYGALVAWVVVRSEAAGLPLANATYGTFRWDNQVTRLAILAVATAVHVAIVRQSHDLRQQRDRAEEASHSKSEFLANMSHEIRTPLNAVLGMMSLLRETPLSATQQEYVATARSSGAALLTVINDILDLSKIEAGRLEIESAPFVLRECLDAAMGMLSPKAQSKGLAFTCRVAEGVPAAIESDPARLRQILVNLLDNALKFTPRGEVRLEVEAGPERDGLRELRFAVRDTGIGIPADRRERLFKPFSQGDSSMSRLYGGTGLGLVISQRLAERLGGRMWVESEPNLGSAFFFTLRGRPAPGVPVRPPSGAFNLAELAARLPLRILLAEDNSINQRVGLLLLERIGYMADVAGNGIEALEALRRQPYDLILMDVQMPVMDGLEATRRIRADFPADRQPRIVALTANVLREQREACLAAGMDDFVQKPVTFEDLQEALCRCGGAELVAPPRAATAAPPVDAGPAVLDPSRLDSLRRLGETAGKPIVQPLVETYLAETPRRLARMRQAVERRDAEDLSFVAHSLKGISAQLGVARVAAVSAEIERLGREAELAAAPGLLAELEREIERAVPLLELERAAPLHPAR